MVAICPQKATLWYNCHNKNKSFLSPLHSLDSTYIQLYQWWVRSQVSYGTRSNINTPRTVAIGLPPTSPLDTIYPYTGKCLGNYFTFNFSLWGLCSYWFKPKCQGFSLKSLPFSISVHFFFHFQRTLFQNLACIPWVHY